jgi:hypothetical protein
MRGSLGIGSGLFSGGIGCVGAVVFVILIVAGIAGMLALVWWDYVGH